MKRTLLTAFTMLFMGALVYFIAGGSAAEAAQKAGKTDAKAS